MAIRPHHLLAHRRRLLGFKLRAQCIARAGRFPHLGCGCAVLDARSPAAYPVELTLFRRLLTPNAGLGRRFVVTHAAACPAELTPATAGLVGGLAHQPMPFEEPLDGPDLRPRRPAQRVARPWEGQHTALGIRGCHEPWPNVTNQRVHLRGGFARQPRGGTRVVLGPRRVGGAYRVRHVASQYWGRPSARPIALAGVPGRERRRASRRS